MCMNVCLWEKKVHRKRTTTNPKFLSKLKPSESRAEALAKVQATRESELNTSQSSQDCADRESIFLPDLQEGFPRDASRAAPVESGVLSIRQ